MNPSGIRNLIALLCEENGQLGIRLASGITEGQTAYAAAEAAAASGRQILIVTASYDRAKRMEEYISFLKAPSALTAALRYICCRMRRGACFHTTQRAECSAISA